MSANALNETPDVAIATGPGSRAPGQEHRERGVCLRAWTCRTARASDGSAALPCRTTLAGRYWKVAPGYGTAFRASPKDQDDINEEWSQE